MIRTFSLMSLACALGVSPVVGQRSRTDTLTHNRVCLVPASARPGIDSIATRCAVDFIKRNGYTAASPTSDSTLWATEGIEWHSTWAEILRDRHNTLVDTPASVGCDSLRCAALFRYTNDTLGCIMRVVIMTRDYKGLLMVHEDAGPALKSAAARRCVGH